ncbi:MAG: DUF488 domain-containing protein [Methylovirgula sp.]
MSIEIRSKRIYDPVEPDDGARVLVDRVWPRGMTKEAAALTMWLKEVAPTTRLRKWFGHEPARWREFRRRYHAELDENPVAVQQLRDLMKAGRVTLVYGAHDSMHNQALALAEYIQAHKKADRGSA